MLIFDRSREGRACPGLFPQIPADISGLPHHLLRQTPPPLPEVTELDVVRHYTRLSQKNFSIDTHFYPLGSCTMKYNPKAANVLARQPGFASVHPLGAERFGQGTLACLYELQEYLKAITGMAAISLGPAAGAQGEFCGVAMIRAYHDTRGDSGRSEILVPDAAHGTNPASAAMCGYLVREIPTNPDGDVDLDALKRALGPKTAGIMLTNPSTLGVFEPRIPEIAALVHEAGGLLYYDGANLNAILGKVLPADMGFDVIHLNLHKTFSTPHGGGGPGAGPVGVNARLQPFLPLPMVARSGNGYRWLTETDCPRSIGRLSAFAGNVGVLLRAYVYIRLLGHKGLERVAEYATLNANYLRKKLMEAGFDTAFPARRAAHEFILSVQRQKKDHQVTALDFAKRLLDYGFHAPTVYFPLLIPECLMIEPTETENKETLDAFADAMAAILKEAAEDPDKLKQAPHHTPIRRLDEVRAARHPDLAWKPASHDGGRG
jgi:glycine dehydrogenase subunit 2